MYRGIVLAIAALIFPVAADAVESARWQGSYSNVCMHPESGDLLGDAVSFIPYAGGMAVLLQRFEGEALAPQLLILREQDGIAVGAEAEGAPPVIRLTREQTRLRVRYLDGQQDSPEGSLRPMPPHYGRARDSPSADDAGGIPRVRPVLTNALNRPSPCAAH